MVEVSQIGVLRNPVVNELAHGCPPRTVALGMVMLIDELRHRQSGGTYKEYRNMFGMSAWRGSGGQEAATGLGLKADDGCCSGYPWY